MSYESQKEQADPLFVQYELMNQLESQICEVILKFQTSQVTMLPHSLVTIVLANAISKVAARGVALEDRRLLQVNRVYQRNQFLEEELVKLAKKDQNT